jgi:hypothetical protein
LGGVLGDCRYCRALLGLTSSLLVMVILAVTGVWNPLPILTSWWDHLTALSDPPPPWTNRLGGIPDSAAVMSGGQVIMSTEGEVQGYEPHTGTTLWSISTTWALPAWDVVVVRLQGTHPDLTGTPNTGYTVIDPANGHALWGIRDAGAVWTFADVILDLSCVTDHCDLRAYAHQGGVLWHVQLPAWVHALHGPNPPLMGLRDPAGWFGKAAAGTPPRLPTVIGFSFDGQITVVDTVLRQAYDVPAPDLRTRVTLAGERLLYVRADPDGDACRFTVTAYDIHDLKPAWPAADWDLDTVYGEACAQRNDPVGADGYFVALDDQQRPLLIDSADGTAAWTGVSSEKVLATDGRLAVVLLADRRTIHVIDLLDPRVPVVYTQSFGLDPQAALTYDQVFIRDGDNEKLWIFHRTLANDHIELHTLSDVIGYGPTGAIIASARRFGFIAFQP